jgi:hypothetical protein
LALQEDLREEEKPLPSPTSDLASPSPAAAASSSAEPAGHRYRTRGAPAWKAAQGKIAQQAAASMVRRGTTNQQALELLAKTTASEREEISTPTAQKQAKAAVTQLFANAGGLKECTKGRGQARGDQRVARLGGLQHGLR